MQKTTAYIRRRRQLNALEKQIELVFQLEMTDVCSISIVATDRIV
jgi:hypothetical protein